MKKYLRPWSSRDQPNCLVPLFPASGKHNVSGKVSIWYWVCFDFYEPKIDLVLRMKVVGAKYVFNDYFGQFDLWTMHVL